MPHLEAVSTPPTRADVWNVSNALCRVHYQLQAEAEPDLLCRALNLFALQCLTPQQVNVQRRGRSTVDRHRHRRSELAPRPGDRGKTA